MHRQAVTCYEQAINFYQRLSEIEGGTELTNDLAGALMNKAVALARLGRLSEALIGYEEAITLRKHLVETEGRTELADDLATALVNKARALEDLN
jgi:tetratricopeptide (TPR) repeat protein